MCDYLTPIFNILSLHSESVMFKRENNFNCLPMISLVALFMYAFICTQIGLRAMPYKEAFITMLADDPHTDTTTDAFRNSLIADGNRYNEAVKRVCSVISEFYMKHNMVVIQDAV